MLMRPETPRMWEKIKKIEKQEAKRPVRRQRIYMGLATSAFLVDNIIGSYFVDVTFHQGVQEDSTVAINAMGAPQDAANDDSALIFMDGWGTYNADNLTASQAPVVQEIVDGQPWSISYGNAPLNPASISNEIIELAEEEDIDRVSLIGYSVGGIIATEVAENIIKDSDIDVEMIMAMSTPDGIDGLRPSHKKDMGIQEAISHIPGSKYSSIARFLVELNTRKEAYAEDPFGTVGSVMNDLQQQQVPGMWLMSDQTLAIANADLESHLSHIGKDAKPGERPVVVYLGTSEPGYDTMVNSEKSSQNICNYAGKAALQCFIYNVPGAVQSHPEVAINSYMETAKAASSEIQQAILEQHTAKLMEAPDPFNFLDITSKN